MPKTKISEFDVDPANNTDINSINIAEGCAPSGINNAIRQLMSDLKEWQSGSQDVYITPAGSVSAPAITTTGDTNTGIYFPAADTIAFTEGGSEVMRINSSGNVGIGTNSPAQKLHVASAGTTAIQVQNTASSGASYIKSTNTATTCNFGVDAIGGYIETLGAYSTLFYTNSLQRMIIDSSGNVGIGLTSPNSKLQVYAGTGVGASHAIIGASATGYWDYSSGGNPSVRVIARGYDSSAVEQIRFDPQGSSFLLGGNVGIGTSSPAGKLGVSDGTVQIITAPFGAGSTGYFGTSTNHAIGFLTNNAERMRIDSSGNLLVGTTSVFGGAPFCVKGPVNANQQVVALWNPATSSTRYFMSFATEGGVTERGYITYNGTSVAISQASDERLKENIVEAPSALPRIEAMRIHSFDFKEDGRHVDYGVIAQELHSVIPAAVFEGSDNEDGTINKPWSVGLEPVIPVLVKAIQEQQAIISDLKARIETLESK
jgi:hypothetical protein